MHPSCWLFFLWTFWYTVQGAQNINFIKEIVHFMLINIIVKSIVYIWFRYQYWLYDTDTIRYFRYSIHALMSMCIISKKNPWFFLKNKKVPWLKFPEHFSLTGFPRLVGNPKILFFQVFPDWWEFWSIFFSSQFYVCFCKIKNYIYK